MAFYVRSTVNAAALLALALTSSQLASVRADNSSNPPPFDDSSDQFYLANQINPANIFSRVGTFGSLTGQPIGPKDWAFDNSNTNSDRRSVRILQTTRGFSNATGARRTVSVQAHR